MRLSTGTGLLTLSVFAFCGLGHGSDQGQAAVSDTKSVASTETCESKTINYITHTLPQQCLRTAWSAANSTVHTGGTEDTVTATVTATASTTTTATVPVNPDTRPEQTADSQAPTETSSEQKDTQEKKEDGHKEDTETKKEDEEEAGDLAVGSFMSFEEWKAMMLKKSGQDPAELKARKQQERDAADATMNNNLESWGDDGEIALDFDVLSDKVAEMAAASARASPDAAKEQENNEPVVIDNGVAHYPKPKDAGKTCKERFSFSSFDGGATVLKTSPGAKNAKAILVENKDSYMLFPCAQENKFVVVELSEDILVDTVVLANFEFFSSMIRAFRVSVSDRYPVKIDKWKDLGTYQARNSRDLQAFLIENPKIWAKYIRIEFLTHYGNEYYCPVSLLRVHGTRMLDSWKDAEAAAEDDEPAETITGPEAVPEPEPVKEGEAPPVEPEPTNATEQIAVHVEQLGQSPWRPIFHDEPHLSTCGLGTPTTEEPIEVSTQANDIYHEDVPAVESTSIAKPEETSTAGESIPPASSSVPKSGGGQPTSSEIPVNTTIPPVYTASDPGDNGAAENLTQATQEPSKPVTAKTSMTPPIAPSASKASTPSSSFSSKTTSNGHSSSKATNNGHQNKTSSSTSTASNPAPTVQESFFKTVSKRLSLLESNTTLSLQYIEDQSKFLQEALQKMERKHVGRVDAFLDNLNKTVLTELHNVRQQYDQIWQSTVIALETQREQSQREIVALSSRLNLLADEAVFQKRMAILQSVLLLCCLVLVIFSRGVFGAGTMMGITLDQWATSTGSFMNPLASPLFGPGSPQSGAISLDQPRVSGRLNGPDGRGNLHPPGSRPNGIGGGGRQDPRAASYYTDKILPLTPTSEYGEASPGVEDSGREEDDARTPTPTPPIIQVEVNSYFDEVEEEEPGNLTPRKSSKSDDNDRPLEERLEKSTSVVTNEETLTEVEDGGEEEEEEEEEESQSSKPPLTRSPLSELGSSRKALPALPEDPS